MSDKLGSATSQTLALKKLPIRKFIICLSISHSTQFKIFYMTGNMHLNFVESVREFIILTVKLLCNAETTAYNLNKSVNENICDATLLRLSCDVCLLEDVFVKFLCYVLYHFVVYIA